MASFTPFPDIEGALLTFLADLGTCYVVAPPDLQNHLPAIRITRFGGADDRVTDVARIDIDVFTADRASGFTISEQIRQRLLGYPLSLTNCIIDRVTTNTGPMEIPWGDAIVRRRNASYSVSCRRY